MVRVIANVMHERRMIELRICVYEKGLYNSKDQQMPTITLHKKIGWNLPLSESPVVNFSLSDPS